MANRRELDMASLEDATGTTTFKFNLYRELAKSVLLSASIIFSLFIVSYLLMAGYIYPNFASQPYIFFEKLNDLIGFPERRHISIALKEQFFMYAKYSMICSLFIGLPFIISIFLKFVVPKIYLRNDVIYRDAIFSIPIMYFYGASLVYLVLFPLLQNMYILNLRSTLLY